MRCAAAVRLLLATLLALAVASPCFAALSALLERGSVAFGESVRLVLETDRRSGDGIDTAPLTTDFDVLSSSRSTQVQIANGRQSVTTRWILELLPRRVGTLTVPALDVDGETSQPLTLEVTDAATAGGANADLFMEAEVAPGRHYVQGQMLYRVRLYMAVPILSGAIGAPEASRANVERLGEDVNYSAVRNGRRYQVVERRYAIFPQESGTLNIGAARFSGQVGNSNGGMSAMDRLLNRGRQTTVIAPPLTVEVLAAPAGFRGSDWLPAQDLQLSEEWPDGQREARVGEPLTRIVRMHARGLQSSQLQIPPSSAGDGMRLYPDQPQRGDGNDGEWVLGTVEQRLALMPTRAGQLQLPELRVRWWDVGSDSERVAVLPARSIEVLPAVLSTGVAQDTPVTVPAPPPAAGETRRAGILWPMLAGLFALLWLATLVAWRQARRVAPVAVAASAAPPARTAEAARRLVLDACARDDAAAARRALVEFASVCRTGEGPAGLAALTAGLPDTELAAELARLDRVLYGTGGEHWTGERLRSLLPARLTANRTGENPPADPLPPLNPPARRSRGSFPA